MGSKADEIADVIRRMAEEVARPLGLEVVDLVFRSQGKHSLLRIDVDREGPLGAGLADCERVSRDLEVLLDRSDPIGGPYDLQVSSPGIERPITTDDDFRRNAGRRVVIETREPHAGRSTFRGVLAGASEGAVRVIEEGDEEVRIFRDLISVAKQDVDADLHAQRGRGGRRERD